MKQEPKTISVTKYRERYISEREDGTFTVSNMKYPSIEKAKDAIDRILSIKKIG